MFKKELFKQNEDDFSNAMEIINNSSSYDHAIDQILSLYAEKYNWDTDKEEVAELFELISRKYFEEMN